MDGKITREKAEEAFLAFDADENGTITKSELKGFLADLFKDCEGVDIEEISAGIIAECDSKVDPDGKISKDEFFKALGV